MPDTRGSSSVGSGGFVLAVATAAQQCGAMQGPDDDDNLFKWTAILQGPEGTPYEGGMFMLDLEFPEEFPFKAPVVTFRTPVYHPNITENGDICLSILLDNCSWEQGWSPVLSVSCVLLSVSALLSDINTAHSLRPALARQYENDRAAFNRMARRFTMEHAMM